MVSWVETPGVHSYGVKRVDVVSGYNSRTKQCMQQQSTSKSADYHRIPMPQNVKENCCCGGDEEEQQRCYQCFHNKAFCVTLLAFFFLVISAMLLCYTYVDTNWKVIRAPAAALMGLWLFVFLITGLVASQLQVIARGIKDCLKSACYCCCKKVEDPVDEDDPFQNHGLWQNQH